MSAVEYVFQKHFRVSGILTHWGRVTYICVSKLTIIDSDNGLSPGRRQAIIWTNAGILLIRTLGANFSEIFSKIRAFSFKIMDLKMSSVKWRWFCLGLNVLKCIIWYIIIYTWLYYSNQRVCNWRATTNTCRYYEINRTDQRFSFNPVLNPQGLFLSRGDSTLIWSYFTYTIVKLIEIYFNHKIGSMSSQLFSFRKH